MNQPLRTIGVYGSVLIAAGVVITGIGLLAWLPLVTLGCALLAAGLIAFPIQWATEAITRR